MESVENDVEIIELEKRAEEFYALCERVVIAVQNSKLNQSIMEVTT